MLVAVGLWRWPPSLSGFDPNRSRSDAALGLADLLAACVILLLGPVIWVRRASNGERVITVLNGSAGVWTFVAFLVSLLLAIGAGLWSIGMVLALARQS